MGAEWEAKTSGRVKLTVYAGGTQGSEDATIRMMRPGVDQLQANLLMLPGLAIIDEAFNVFGIPFFFQSDAEGQYVLEKLTPMLEKRLEAKGFKLLAWGSAGWVQLFSKKPLTTLADVKAAKLFTSQGDDRMVQWYKANGFHPVALAAGDIPAQLKLTTGMIDAAPRPPYPALAAPDLPRREVHARRPRRAALSARSSSPTRPGTRSRPADQAGRAWPRPRRSRSACSAKRPSWTPTRSRR